METPCKDCYWADYYNTTQVGCKLGKLEKFRAAGYEILECYDQDKEFYVIKAICPFFRTQEWANKIQDDIKLIPEIRIEQEVQPRYHIIIDYNLFGIKQFIDRLLESKPKPNTITVLNRYGATGVKRLSKILHKVRVNYWRIQTVEDGDFNRAVDIAVAAIRDPIFVVLKEPKDSLGENLTRWLTEDFKPFAAIGDTSYISTRGIHSTFGGNIGGLLIDKLRQSELAVHIWSWEDFAK